MIPAQVVGRDPSGWYNTLLIGKGAKDGLRQDMAVVLFLVGTLPSGDKPRETWGIVERIVAEAAGPFQRAFHYVTASIGGIWSGYVDLVHVRKENQKLKKENQKLKFDLSRLEEEAQASKRLRKLLDFTQAVDFDMIPAQVVGRDPSGWYNTLLIGKGAKDGLRQDMAVVSHQGVVGRIVSVSGNYAKVLLIIDQNSAVDALIQESRRKGILIGGPGKLCRLNYISPLYTINAGDSIVTSGLDGIFPKGLPLGTVKNVESEKRDMFQKILVRPAVDFSRLEEVLVILGNHDSMGKLP